MKRSGRRRDKPDRPGGPWVYSPRTLHSRMPPERPACSFTSKRSSRVATGLKAALLNAFRIVPYDEPSASFTGFHSLPSR